MTLYDEALQYQAAGLPIFPCQPRGKEPVSARGCLDATIDPDRIKGWWSQIPDLNIGLATGTPSGLFVVDIDGEDGYRTIADLQATHGELPATKSVITGREGRGEHLYFKLGAHAVRNSAGLVGPGIDVRGTGGYVILPPSFHPSGAAYAWSVDSADTFAAAPDWLHAIIDEKASNGRSNGRNGAPQIMEFWDDFLSQDQPEGGRHCALLKFVGKYFHAGLRDPFLLHHAAILYNTVRCKPPLGSDELLRAVTYVVQSQLQQERDRG